MITMMPTRKTNPRAEYRLRENERANNSVSLAVKFPKLKSLLVNLAYFDADGRTKSGDLKYQVNVKNAKSVFSFACPSNECLAGGFDLSAAVAEAVVGKRKVVEGEIGCPGWRTKPKEAKTPCKNLLRYKMKLGYA